jgi:L-seryl-tRNA(Ser) seleniumtransferase
VRRGDRKHCGIEKAEDQSIGMKRSALRDIPSVDKLAQALGDTGLPYAVMVEAIRRDLAALRKHGTIPPYEEILSRLRSTLQALSASRLQPLINGTGILVHTNFGRAPLGPAVMEAVSRIGSQYNNLEYGLADGGRGGRAAYLEQNLALLCGAEAATVVNNNASALVLILQHFCKNGASESNLGRKRRRIPCSKNQVIISRGELIQIGGGFRIPEILEASGARLREVGTTNKTSLADFSRAITRETALILKVHRSNFFMDGFVDSPSTEAIAKLARGKRIPFVEDLGSGAMTQTESIPGLEHEPTPAEALRNGVVLVCFSGDKLFGGPQAGIIAGKSKLIAGLKRESLFRALRCDKLILAALEATVDIYLRNAAGSSTKSAPATAHYDIPLLAMLHVSNEELQMRAGKIIAALDGLPLKAAIGKGRAQTGGGALPRSTIQSTTLDITHGKLKPQEVAARLRLCTPPIVGYIERGQFKLDLRTVFAHQDFEIVAALKIVN